MSDAPEGEKISLFVTENRLGQRRPPRVLKSVTAGKEIIGRFREIPM